MVVDGLSLTFLGAGSMGGAIVRGVAASNALLNGAITVVNRSRASADSLAGLPGVVSVAIEDEPDATAHAVASADVIVVGVKPAGVPTLLTEIRDLVSAETVIVSIAAGITTRALEAALSGEARVIRAMPNTPVSVRAGVTGIAAGRNASVEDVGRVRAIFETVGMVSEVEESAIDSLTAISGSGPAYVFLLIEEFTAAAQQLGFSAQAARALSEQTFIGSAKLLAASGEPPAELRRRVTSPRGTTEQGVSALQASGLEEVFARAMRAARDRAIELGS